MVVVHDDRKRHRSGQRTINGTVGLKVPVDVVRAKCASLMRKGKPVHRMELTNHTPFSIVSQYNQQYVGLVDYYRLAYNLHRLTTLQWVVESSLSKTLARKLRISVKQVYARFQVLIDTAQGTRRVLRVTVEREGKAPLVAQWGGVSLARRSDVVLNPNQCGTDRRKSWSASSPTNASFAARTLTLKCTMSAD